MRHIIRFVLPVVVVFLFTSLLPVLPTNLGGLNQSAEVISSFDGAGGSSSGGIGDISGSGGSATIGNTMNNAVGDDFGGGALPVQKTGGLGDVTDTGGTAGSLNDVTGTAGGTGGSSLGLDDPVYYQIIIPPLTGGSQATGDSQLTTDDGSLTTDATGSAGGTITSGTTDGGSLTGTTQTLQGTVGQPLNQLNQWQQQILNQQTLNQQQTQSSLVDAGSGDSDGGAAVSNKDQGVPVWISPGANVVTVNNALIGAGSPDSTGSQFAPSVTSPSGGDNQVYLMKGTQNISPIPIEGYISVIALPTTFSATEVTTIATEANSDNQNVIVQHAGDLLAAITLETTNKILGQEPVQTTKGTINNVPTVKTTVLSALGDGVLSVFSNIGNFFSGLFGGGGAGSGGGAGGIGGGAGGAGGTGGNSFGDSTTDDGGGKACSQRGVDGMDVPICGGSCPDENAKCMLDVNSLGGQCSCQVQSNANTPDSDPELICPKPEKTKKTFNSDATAEATFTITLKYGKGPRTEVQDQFTCTESKTEQYWDPSEGKMKTKETCVRGFTSSVAQTSAGPLSSPSRYVPASSPVPPSDQGVDKGSKEYKDAVKKYEDDVKKYEDEQKKNEEDKKGNVGPVRQRSDAEMQRALAQQILKAITDSSSGLSKENPKAAEAWKAALTAAKAALDADLADQLSKGWPDCSASLKTKCQDNECGACGVLNASPTADTTWDPATIEILGHDGSETNGAPSGSKIASGQVSSVTIKIKQVGHKKVEIDFNLGCGGNLKSVDIPPATDPPAEGGGGGGGGGGGKGNPAPNPDDTVAPPPVVPPPPPEPPKDKGPFLKKFADQLGDALKNVLDKLKNLFGGGGSPTPVDPYAPIPVEEPPVDPPVDDAPSLPPLDRDFPFSPLGEPTTNPQLKCQSRSITDEYGNKTTKCIGGSDCGNGQECSKTPSGGCACLKPVADPASPNVPASPPEPKNPPKEPSPTDQVGQKNEPPSVPETKTVTSPKKVTLNNCQLTPAAVGFEFPTEGKDAGMIIFVEANGTRISVMSYAAFQALGGSDAQKKVEAQKAVMENTKTSSGMSIAAAANVQARSVCTTNQCKAGGQSCTFDPNRSNLNDRCYCGSPSTPTAPSKTPPAAPPAPVAKPACEDSVAPVCGGTCSNGACGPKTYPICGDEHDDYPGLASGWTAQDWADKKKEMEGQCGTVNGKGASNCKCSTAAVKTPPAPVPTSVAQKPAPKPSPSPVTAECKYTYRYVVEIWTAQNCGPCGLYKPAPENTGSETIDQYLNTQTNAGKNGTVTVKHHHIPSYQNTDSPLGSTPTYRITMYKVADSSNGSQCSPTKTVIGNPANPRSFAEIANALVSLFQNNK
ncbi:MAG: hypothetical protein Q7R62_03305 [bacterium]|nr:hypothetical protein [bacterium]